MNFEGKIKRIAVSSPSFSKNSILVNELRESFPNIEIKFNFTGKHFKGKDLVEFFSGFDSVIVGTEKVNSEILENLPDLKIISKYGVGTDNIDLMDLENRNIHFHWEGGVNRRSVSEMALCFLIGLSRNLFFTNFMIRQGEWIKNGGFQLSGKTIGIIGCGFIGEDLIRLLQPFHCNVLFNDILEKPHLNQIYGARQINLDDLLIQSDFVTLHVPLTEKTEYLVDLNFLSKMKKGAFLINTSRGAIVEQKALQKYLNLHIENKNDSTIAGAAIDVLEVEPPEDFQFLKLPNLFSTPHIGGNAFEAVLSMGRSAISGMVYYNTIK
jgi:phosphoglycerate dehydrogenase-like enzyme